MMVLALHFVLTFTQLHGAAYGKGIYLSPVSTISFGYTGYYGTGKPEVCESHWMIPSNTQHTLAMSCTVTLSFSLQERGRV